MEHTHKWSRKSYRGADSQNELEGNGPVVPTFHTREREASSKPDLILTSGRSCKGWSSQRAHKKGVAMKHISFRLAASLRANFGNIAYYFPINRHCRLPYCATFRLTFPPSMCTVVVTAAVLWRILGDKSDAKSRTRTCSCYVLKMGLQFA